MEYFNLTVISPTEVLCKDNAVEVILPAKEGNLTILARHAPVLSVLKKGTIQIKTNSSEKKIDITSGFIEVSKKETSKNNSSFVNIFVK